MLSLEADHENDHNEDVVVSPSEVLAMREPVERLGGLIDQRHAAGLPGLGRVLLPSPDRTAHVKEPIHEVDVPPAQGPELALSEPREGRHGNQRPLPYRRCATGDRMDFGWR